MKSIHNITTKVFETEFWFGHYTVLLYDDKNYELYEMSRPMDYNGIDMILSFWLVDNDKFVDTDSPQMYTRYIEEFWKEIPMEELMNKDNEDLRTAIKTKQEQFYHYQY